MLLRSISLIFILVIAGCSSVPEPIQLADDNQLIEYSQAASASEQNQGESARWGGVIARIENLPDTTMLEMVHYPLRGYGRPMVSDESIGRFRVYVDGFLDPLVYETGRAMTFVGEFIGVEEGAVGDHKYVFPTLNASGHYLWKDISRIEMSTISFWPYDHFWGYPYRPYRQRVIIRSQHKDSGSIGRSGIQNRPAGTVSKPSTPVKQQY